MKLTESITRKLLLIKFQTAILKINDYAFCIIAQEQWPNGIKHNSSEGETATLV